MKFRSQGAGWIALAVFIVALILCAVALFAPHIGLGAKTDFILYRWFHLPRKTTFGLGLLMLGVLAVAVFWSTWQSWLRQSKDDVSHEAGRFGRRIERQARSAAASLQHYYGFGPRAPRPQYPARDRAILLGAGAVLQAVYLFVMPIIFECDAVTYHDYGKALLGLGGSISNYRPPLYPIFQVLTGAIWPGTFVFTMLVQAVMGAVIPWLIYRSLFGLGRWPAWIGALTVIISGTPFVSVNFALSEPLFTFLSVLTVFCLARYQDSRDPRFIFAFVLSGLAAMLTRWESMFIVIFGGCAILVLTLQRPRQLRHGLLAVMLAFVVLGSYSTARAILIGDLRLIGNLQSGTGFQLFHRLYGFSTRVADAEKTGIFGKFDPAKAPHQLINVNNGPATKELRDLYAKYAREHPESYRNSKPGIDKMYTGPNSPPPKGPYYELFGRFEGKPDALADHIFRSGPNFMTMQYAFYVTAAAEQVLGLTAGDRLLRRVALETLWAHPKVAIVMAFRGLSYFGVDAEAIVDIKHDPLSLRSWAKLFPYWSTFSWARMPFNAGGCAAASLSPHMFSEYRWDQEFTNNAFSERAIEIAGVGRNLVRAVCGGIVLFGWWLLFFAPRPAFTLPVLFSVASLSLTVGALAGRTNGKYDLCIIPLMVIVAVSIATEAYRRLSRVARS